MNSSKVCNNCATPNSDEAMFCKNCGGKFLGDEIAEESHDNLLDANVPCKQSKVFPLTDLQRKLAVTFLLITATLGLANWIFQSVVNADQIGSIANYLVDIFLAISLYKKKVWARTWIILRCVLGAVIYAGIFIEQKEFGSLITNSAIMVGLLFIVSPYRSKRFLIPGISIWAIGLASWVFISAPAIIQHIRVNTSGASNYISEKYGYEVHAPEDWVVVGPSGVKSLYPTSASDDIEAVVVRKDLQASCQVMAEDLEGLPRAGLLSLLRTSAVTILSNLGKPIIERNIPISKRKMNGFILYGHYDEEGKNYFSLQYLVMASTGYQVFCSGRLEKEKVLEDYESIMGSITFK